jgi:hypothetical protein
MKRKEEWIKKFNVSDDEFSESARRTFPLAGLKQWTMKSFNDSAVLLSP